MRSAPPLALALLLGLPGLLLWWTTAPAPTVSGQVRPETPGFEPLSGVRVRFKGQPNGTLTDAQGRFLLRGLFRPSDRVTAAREGYLIAGAPARSSLSLQLTPLPPADCERYRWVAPKQCGTCHEAIYREWSLSGHARSLGGQHFRNLYDGSDVHGRPGVSWNLLGEYPDGAGVCAACHAPTAPADEDLRLAHGVDAQGVHCDYCHKVAGATGAVGLTHGRYGLELRRPAEGQLFLGALDDVDRGEDAFSPLYRSSRYCASCHEGTVIGVHVYGTYSEWLASPAARQGQQCQDCHMAPTGTLTNVAPGKGGIRRDPYTLANHRFFAGSQLAMLRRSLHLSAQVEQDGEQLRLVVDIGADGVGHRVPTGFVDRHLILAVGAFGPGERPLPTASGPLLPAAAGPDLAGHPGRLYARLLRDFDGHSPAPFWRADPEATDTRLVPGQPERVAFTFSGRGERVRLRLLYRRFWQEVAEAKGWGDNELVLADQVAPIASPGSAAPAGVIRQTVKVLPTGGR